MQPSEDILHLLPVAVLVFNREGRLSYANHAACRLLRFDLQQAQGNMYHHLIPELDTANYSPHPGLPEQSAGPLAHLQNGKVVLTRNSQKLFCRSLCVSENGSQEERVVLLVEDMQDNSNLAGRVLEEERLMGVTEISNTMAHKLNQYLQVIMGYVSLMSLEMDPGHHCYEYVYKILEQLENIRNTTYLLSNIHRYAIVERPDGRRMFDLDRAAEDLNHLNFK